MVTGRILCVLLAFGLFPACRSRAELPPTLRFSSTTTHGQRLETLYCGKDSCYLMVFAPGFIRPASVGLFGTAINKDSLAKGDSLVMSVLQTKGEVIPLQQVSTSFAIQRNDTQVTIPRHPKNQERLSPLLAWVQNRKMEVRVHTLWRDSLIMMQSKPGSRDVWIRLASASNGKGMFGIPSQMKIVLTHSAQARSDTWETQVDLPEESLLPILSGISLQYRVPDDVQSVEAIFKVYSDTTSPPLPNSSMRGRFELISEPLVFPGKKP